MDIGLIEHIVKKKNSPLVITAKVAAVAAAAVAAYYILLIDWLYGFNLPVVALLAYVVYIALSYFDYEFEYSIVEDELQIDKIVSKRKRFKLLTVQIKDLEKLAPVSEANMGEFSAHYQKVFDCASSSASDKRWYAVFNGKEGRTKLVFEPTERMLNAFRKLIPRKVADR